MTTIFGNSPCQQAILRLISPDPPSRITSLTGPSRLGKRTFLESVLQESVNEADLLICPGTVDGLREARQFCVTEPAFGDFRAVMVDLGRNVGWPAQDACLKLFEEPPPSVRIFLIVEDEFWLQSSLRSRIRLSLRWSLLSEEEMTGFALSKCPSVDQAALRLSYGRPGLYEAISARQGLISLHEATSAALEGRYDPLFDSAPEVLSSLKEEIDRDAAALIIAESARAHVALPSRRRAIPFLKLSSVLTKVPSANAEIHWIRACLAAAGVTSSSVVHPDPS
jgi:hypothetical protein